MKQRNLDPDFWLDEYISNLNSNEKLLYIYCLTNPAVTIAGIYQLPISHISSATDIDIEESTKILKKLSLDKKIYHIDGWLYIKNYIKKTNSSKTVNKGISYFISELPLEIKNKIIKADPTSYISEYDGYERPIRPSYKLKKKILIKKYNNMCQICNTKNIILDVHHIIPLEDGGSNDLENLILLCKKCHEKEHKILREVKFNG